MVCKAFWIFLPWTKVTSVWKGLRLDPKLINCIVITELLTLILVVTYLAKTKWCRNTEKWMKPWHMGTHLRVLSDSYPMNTNMTGFRWFSKIFVSSIGRARNPQLTLMLLVANLVNSEYLEKSWNMTENLANRYSYVSTQWKLSNGYQRDRI